MMWTFHMLDLSWMAWTVPTAIFFTVIALLLVTFTILEIKYPTVERQGILGIPPPAATACSSRSSAAPSSTSPGSAWSARRSGARSPSHLIYAAIVFWLV